MQIKCTLPIIQRHEPHDVLQKPTKIEKGVYNIGRFCLLKYDSLVLKIRLTSTIFQKKFLNFSVSRQNLFTIVIDRNVSLQKDFKEEPTADMQSWCPKCGTL